MGSQIFFNYHAYIWLSQVLSNLENSSLGTKKRLKIMQFKISTSTTPNLEFTL